MEWQPIETAPKDGTEILLWAKSRIGRITAIGYYSKYWNEWKMSFGISMLIPTHWMSLPDPPKE